MASLRLQRMLDARAMCFVGYTHVAIEQKVRDIRAHSNGRGDWLVNESDTFIQAHIANMITYSQTIKSECEKYALPYFDTSENFVQAIEDATEYLLGNKIKAQRV